MKLRWQRGVLGQRHLMCPLCGRDPLATLYRDEDAKVWRATISGCLLLQSRPGRKRRSQVVVADPNLRAARAAVTSMVEGYIRHRLGIKAEQQVR